MDGGLGSSKEARSILHDCMLLNSLFFFFFFLNTDVIIKSLVLVHAHALAKTSVCWKCQKSSRRLFKTMTSSPHILTRRARQRMYGSSNRRILHVEYVQELSKTELVQKIQLEFGEICTFCRECLLLYST
jgi:hypothetical protein